MTLPPSEIPLAANARPGPLSIALIAAVAGNGVIGAANALPWRLPEDLRRFRSLTTGHAIVMGRKTWQSLARALPERQNIVVTRDATLRAEGAQFAPSLDAALALVDRPAPVFVIGGAELYALALPRAQRLYLTEIAQDFDGDVRFPAFDRHAWREIAREQSRSAADGLPFAFVTYDRAG